MKFFLPMAIFALTVSCGLRTSKDEARTAEADWSPYFGRIEQMKNHPDVKAASLPFPCWPSLETSNLFYDSHFNGTSESATRFCRKKGTSVYAYEEDVRLGVNDNDASYVRFSRLSSTAARMQDYRFGRVNFRFVDTQNWRASVLCSTQDPDFRSATSKFKMQKTLQLDFEMQNGKLVKNSVEEIPFQQPEKINRTPEIEICKDK